MLEDERSSSPNKAARSGGGSRKIPVFTVVTKTGFLEQREDDVCLIPVRAATWCRCSFLSFESRARTKLCRLPRSSSPSSSAPPPPPPPPPPITMNDVSSLLLPVPFSRIVVCDWVKQGDYRKRKKHGCTRETVFVHVLFRDGDSGGDTRQERRPSGRTALTLLATVIVCGCSSGSKAYRARGLRTRLTLTTWAGQWLDDGVYTVKNIKIKYSSGNDPHISR